MPGSDAGRVTGAKQQQRTANPAEPRLTLPLSRIPRQRLIRATIPVAPVSAAPPGNISAHQETSRIPRQRLIRATIPVAPVSAAPPGNISAHQETSRIAVPAPYPGDHPRSPGQRSATGEYYRAATGEQEQTKGR